MPRQAR